MAEAAKVWSEPVTRDDSIQLTDEKIETIKSLMSGVVLGNVPGERGHIISVISGSSS